MQKEKSNSLSGSWICFRKGVQLAGVEGVLRPTVLVVARAAPVERGEEEEVMIFLVSASFSAVQV